MASAVAHRRKERERVGEREKGGRFGLKRKGWRRRLLGREWRGRGAEETAESVGARRLRRRKRAGAVGEDNPDGWTPRVRERGEEEAGWAGWAVN
jgi:hypothetical protein